MIKLFSRKGKKFYFFIRKTAGYCPTDISVFESAFVHKSASAKVSNHNERLEYLGDAVLGVAVAEILYKRFPDADEGFLSKLRSDLVSRKQLNAVAQTLEFYTHIKYHVPHKLSSTHIPGDALEAFIAAIYLDAGIGKARKFVERHIANDRYIQQSLTESATHNYKSNLLEWSQRKKVEVLFETHQLNDAEKAARKHITFVSTVYVGGIATGEGSGTSKKIAEQNAAKNVINGVKLSQLNELFDV